MEVRYQWAVADGSPKWTVGAHTFLKMWDPAFDRLRFHRGQGFTITERPGGKPGPVRHLNDCAAIVASRLLADEGPLEVRSLADGFAIICRRMEVVVGGDRIVEHEIRKLDTPYVFGVTDCSWLDAFAYDLEGVFLPHNAHAQHLTFMGATRDRLTIGRAQIKRGDLLWHDDDHHVSTYWGDYHGIEAVIDTEPHDTAAPRGWPTPNLGVGVQFRPMIGNYYCNWNDVNGIGRVVDINGKP